MDSVPTLAGFITFITTIMGIPATALTTAPTPAPIINIALQIALNIVNLDINTVNPQTYTWAVYNLSGSYLLQYTQDPAGSSSTSTYFADLRNKWNILGYVSGTISSSSDESTSQSLVVPQAAETFTLEDLQLSKDPYGRAYLQIAQKYGTLWGVS